MGLADSHVHLHAFADPRALLARARRAGVQLFVGFGVDLATSRETIDVARQEHGVVAAVGLHPVHLVEALDLDRAIAEIKTLTTDPRVGFIGEIGLDVVDGNVGLDRQLAAFEAQLRLAARLDRPVSLHVQGAFDEAFAAIRRVGLPAAGGVVHYFVGDDALARRALDLGLHLSVGKPVTREANRGLREVVSRLSMDRLLLETDAYPLPGRSTEPRDVVAVAEAVAGLSGLSPMAVADATTANLLRLLGDRAPATLRE